MRIEEKIQEQIIQALWHLYQAELLENQVDVTYTRKEFDGDFTVVVFPFLKSSKKSPEATAIELGQYLQEHVSEITGFNVIKGFLNISLKPEWWFGQLKEINTQKDFGVHQKSGQRVVVEYCGPNTNKPLHLGHIRNMILGYSVAEILAANGHEVIKVNINNDRGIAISKSMVTWMRAGGNDTPESTGMKGDHLVGKFYVEYEQIYKQEVQELKEKGEIVDEERVETPISRQAREVLQNWESGDDETMSLWKKMNGWVYKGFDETYRKIGIDFKKEYYESDTWTIGKEMVLQGLEQGVFFRKDDGSVWIDLTEDGLDQKLLLRSDGTTVYITQDMGTAKARYEDFTMDRSIYVVANEQDYHFQVLKLILKKMGVPYADGIFHLSYGMVDLPTGKMKSREGTVVDADDLLDEMFRTAEFHTKELGKIDDFTEEEAQKLYRTIGLGALKFFIARVDPKKRMLFNPAESIDFHGQTGPFVQYTYARIRSVLRKWGKDVELSSAEGYELQPVEREVLREIYRYPTVVAEAGAGLDPSTVANYAYNLAKAYNKFYAELSILKAGSEEEATFRIALSDATSKVLKSAFKLLGVDVPEQM